MTERITEEEFWSRPSTLDMELIESMVRGGTPTIKGARFLLAEIYALRAEIAALKEREKRGAMEAWKAAWELGVPKDDWKATANAFDEWWEQRQKEKETK